MNPLNIISDLKLIDNKIIFLILVLPISLLAGSLIININILLLIIFFLIDLYKKKNFKILKKKEIYFLLLIWVYLIFNALLIGKTEDGIIRAVGFFRFIILTIVVAYYISYENFKYKNIILKIWLTIFFVVTFDPLK